MSKWIGIFFVLVLTSCASVNTMRKGVGRVRKYSFEHKDIPEAFDNYRIVFLTDFHYKSLFTEKKLSKLIKTVNSLHADLLLLGGDFHEGCRYVPALFDSISLMKSTHGVLAVLGNNDYEDCYREIRENMESHGFSLLEHRSDTIRRDDAQIIITGIRNPFDLEKNGTSPTLDLAPEDFVIMLVHTPDYSEDVKITNTDLVLAGHTHGGQVTLFGLYAPVTASKYGQRFRSGLKYNSGKTPVIISNGIGTSRKNIRLFAPSEVAFITLKRR